MMMRETQIHLENNLLRIITLSNDLDWVLPIFSEDLTNVSCLHMK